MIIAMQGFKTIGAKLKSEVIYEFVKSRRLGTSLGINLFSNEIKGCNFDCPYCQYGRTYFSKNSFLRYEHITREITKYFEKIANDNIPIDYITLAGIGEPTLHPEFEKIANYILQKRDELLPNTPTSLFTNATLLNNENIRKVIEKFDKTFVKIDASGQNSFIKLGGKGNFNEINESILITSIRFPIEISTAVIKNPEHYSNYEQLKSIEFAEIINKIKPTKLILYSINKTPAEIAIERIAEKELYELKEYLEKIINVPVEMLL